MLVLVTLAGLGTLTACGGSSSNGSATTTVAGSSAELSGVVADPPTDVSKLSLPAIDKGGESFKFVAPKGELLVVYFGYTSCPDVCPTTLADFKAALARLGSSSDRVSLAMATIDPRRDTPAKITKYVQSFIPTATVLRTDDDAALRAVTTGFGASYQTDYANPDSPEVAHSGFMYVVDDAGHVVLSWPFGIASKDMANDLKLLLKAAT